MSAFLKIDVRSSEFPGTQSNEEPVPSKQITRSDIRSEAPDDSNWHCKKLPNGLELHRQGRLQIGAVAGLVFVNAFWSGIVSVFVLGLFGFMPGHNGIPAGFGWWGMFVFLIPFEVIGLTMLAGLVVATVEPFRRTCWRVNQGQASCETKWPLLRRLVQFRIDSTDHLELRFVDEDSEQEVWWRSWQGWMDSGSFQLTFVDTSNTDICTLGGLTEGEARWIAGLLLNYHPKWIWK